MSLFAAGRLARPLVALALAVGLALPPVAVAQPAAGGVGPTFDAVVRDLPQTLATEGVVEAVRQATLGAQVAGRIVELPVKAGDAVRAGQVLARIDARAADAAVAGSRSQLAEAEANLANAKRVHERNKALVAQKFVSQAAVDQSESAYQAALAQVEVVRANAGSAVVARDWTTIASTPLRAGSRCHRISVSPTLPAA